MPYTPLEYWVWLTMAFGPANSRKWNFLSHYGSVDAAFEAISNGDFTRVLPADIKRVSSASIEQAVKMTAFCEEKGIKIASFDSSDYPERLKMIYNPPSVLFYRGDISEIDEDIVITAVGTRKPSEYSVAVSQRICRDLAKTGVVIASGFALGLDSVAHSSAMKAGGKTIAVLPCGLLHDYPAENAGAKSRVAEHGAVISEYFPADKPSPLSFRARNRILSGIGLGTLVLQTGLKGGSMSTVSFALAQGKDIFCIPPHELFNSEYAGNSALIRDGATPVFDSGDIICTYTSVYPNKLQQRDALQRASDYEDRSAIPPKAEKKQIEKKKRAKKLSNNEDTQTGGSSAVEASDYAESPVKYPDLLTLSEGLRGTKKLIYDYLRENGETHLDQLAVGIADVYELEAFLTELELEGLIKPLPGNRFTI